MAFGSIGRRRRAGRAADDMSVVGQCREMWMGRDSVMARYGRLCDGPRLAGDGSSRCACDPSPDKLGPCMSGDAHGNAFVVRARARVRKLHSIQVTIPSLVHVDCQHAVTQCRCLVSRRSEL
jgi:hypothetical protein